MRSWLGRRPTFFTRRITERYGTPVSPSVAAVRNIYPKSDCDLVAVGPGMSGWPRPSILRANPGLRLLIPALPHQDSLAPSGVRAQAVFPIGELADELVIETSGRAIDILNARYPAATSSLAVGSYVANLASEVLAN